MAYRCLPEVIAQHTGTVKVLHTLRPFAVAMGARASSTRLRIRAHGGGRPPLRRYDFARLGDSAPDRLSGIRTARDEDRGLALRGALISKCPKPEVTSSRFRGLPAATPSETVVTRSSEVAIPVAELQTPYCHASSTGSFAPHTKGTGLDAAIAKRSPTRMAFACQSLTGKTPRERSRRCRFRSGQKGRVDSANGLMRPFQSHSDIPSARPTFSTRIRNLGVCRPQTLPACNVTTEALVLARDRSRSKFQLAGAGRQGATPCDAKLLNRSSLP